MFQREKASRFFSSHIHASCPLDLFLSDWEFGLAKTIERRDRAFPFRIASTFAPKSFAEGVSS